MLSKRRACPFSIQCLQASRWFHDPLIFSAFEAKHYWSRAEGRRAVIRQVPYCGAAPLPGELLTRFNLDPLLILALGVLCVCQLIALRKHQTDGDGHYRVYAVGGWLVASAALLSPLCALSVALFSARLAQHMILILAAAPLIAVGLPRAQVSPRSWPLWGTTAIFFLALWFWHMPRPYDATFTFVHMGLLGVVLTFAQRPMFQWHFLTTTAWGLTPLQDQQLGGTLMWVPGIVLFLWTAIRSIVRAWGSIERERPA